MTNITDVSTGQAAKMLNSCNRTVINYCVRGKLQGKKNPVTGVWRVSLSSLENLLKEMNAKSNADQ
jgi:hypothetical protein